MGGGKEGGTEHPILEVYRTSTFGSFIIRVIIHLGVDRSEHPFPFSELKNLYRTKTISTVLSLGENHFILFLKEFFFVKKGINIKWLKNKQLCYIAYK